MTIEIRDIGGKVIYTATGAADVRAALEAAVKDGADLARAYLARANLARAYLAGADLARADLARAYLARANLARADLAGADLTGADLTGANLTGADLTGAYLAGADLTGAYLTGADLTGAYLAGATGTNPLRINDLLMLYDQSGPIRAYKLTDAGFRSPIQATGKLTYRVGDTIEVPDANTDASIACAAGVNVATLPWVMREWREGYHVMVVEFTAADIAAIPTGDGKFRVRRCTVVGEKDLVELGLVEKPKRKRAAKKEAAA